MKIRLAKKIIHQQPENDLPLHKVSLYWVIRWNRLNMQTWNIKPKLKGKIDHRITKAERLTSKKRNMEIPSKIYINSEQAQKNDVCYYWEFATEKRLKDDDVEFTNLSPFWHDAKKEKHPEGVCGNNPVVVVGLRNGRISYRYLWEDMEDCWKDLEVLADCKAYDKALWAYLRDLVPGVKEKGL